MSRQVLRLHHELEDAQADALPLQRLVDVEVENATRLDLLHGPTCDVERLVPGLKESKCTIALHDHVQILVARRLN